MRYQYTSSPRSDKNLLKPFFVVSAMLHAFVLLLFLIFHPLLTPKPRLQIITFQLNNNDQASSTIAPNPTPSPKPSVSQSKVETPKPVPKTIETPVTKPPVRKTITPPKAPAQPSLKTPPVTTPPKLVSQTPTPPPKSVIPNPPPKALVQTFTPQVTKNPTKNLEQEENDALANQLENLLQNSTPSTTSSDYLAGGSWIGSPRKTLSFPDIKTRIAELENTKGFGYSVTARITFTPQGWVSLVELTKSSGDPRIDHIFRNELRKIRIEESRTGRIDTLVKSFVVSVQ